MITIRHWLQEFLTPTEEELQAIEAITETTHVSANEIILKQGQVAARIGMLLQGVTRTFYTDAEGSETVIGFAFEGQPLIVVDSFFNRSPSAVSSAAIEPCTILWTDFERYSSFISQHPRYNTVLVAALTKWFAEGKQRMEYLHQPSAKTKYQKMCEIHPQIVERVPLKHIASYLGITQETLSRIRNSR